MSESASTTPKPVRAPAKRGSRACTQCRKLKKTCEPGPMGGDCQRCSQSGLQCIFDRPASSVVDDAGLNRLSSIEAHLSTQERRLDTLTTSVGELLSNVSEILTWIRSSGGSPTVHPGSYGHSQTPQVSSAPLPVFSTSIFNPSGGTSTLSEPKLNPPTFPMASTSRLEALAALATDESTPGIDNFASRLHAPIQALADAADQVQGQERQQFVDEDEKQQQESPDASEERPKKRTRLSIVSSTGPMAPVPVPTPGQFDVVAKGLISDRDARALVALWLKELQPFCAVLSPATDTYSSLRRNRFLFDVVCFTASRAQGGTAPPSKEFIAIAEQTRESARNLIFDTAPALEVVQALLVMSCWHDEPYVMSGYALRLALSARLDTVFEQLDAHGWDKTDDRALCLTAQLRTWIYLIFIEFKHSRSTGRMILIREADFEKLEANADRLVTLPFAIPSDQRVVANFRLTCFERRIIQASRDLQRRGQPDLQEQVAYVYDMRDQLQRWHSHFDALLAMVDPSPLAWPRRSHLRQLQEVSFFLPANILGKVLLEPNNPPEVVQIAVDALGAARGCLRTVLQSPAYNASVKFSGYLMRVDLSFAALLILKLAAILPHLVSPDEIAEEITQLSNLLSVCAGTQRYSTTLRFARDQYLAKVHDEPISNIVKPEPPTLDEPIAVAPPAKGTGALLPGETEFDWATLPTEFLGSEDWMTGVPDPSWPWLQAP